MNTFFSTHDNYKVNNLKSHLPAPCLAHASDDVDFHPLRCEISEVTAYNYSSALALDYFTICNKVITFSHYN